MTGQNLDCRPKLDAFRFCIGPWKGRYSSVWRVWSPKRKDDIYLGAKSLLNKIKISLHESGQFHAAFVEDYYAEIVEDGKSGINDRFIVRWERPAIADGVILQVLDLHFPLPALSFDQEPVTDQSKVNFIFQPEDSSIGDNDSVTIRILFHSLNPESAPIRKALVGKGLLLLFYFQLRSGGYASFVSCYTKQLPKQIDKKLGQQVGRAMMSEFEKLGKGVGDKIEDLTLLQFKGGSPPSITSIGRSTFELKPGNEISLSVSA